MALKDCFYSFILNIKLKIGNVLLVFKYQGLLVLKKIVPGPSISEVGAQDSNTNTAAAVTVPLVFVFAIAGAAAAFMYKKNADKNKVESVPNETNAPLPEDNI